MTTIHPAQRLLLSALAVTVSGAAAYGETPITPSRLPLDLQEFPWRRPEIGNSEVTPNANSDNPTEVVDFPT